MSLYLTDQEKEEIRARLVTQSDQIFFLPQLETPLRPDKVFYYYMRRMKWEAGEGNKVALFFGDWPTRNQVNKGVSKLTPFASRWMEREEMIEQKLRTRLYSVSYDSWQALIDDEIKYQVERQFIDELITYSKTHRLRVPYDPHYIAPAERDPPAAQASLFPDNSKPF